MQICQIEFKLTDKEAEIYSRLFEELNFEESLEECNQSIFRMGLALLGKVVSEENLVSKSLQSLISDFIEKRGFYDIC